MSGTTTLTLEPATTATRVSRFSDYLELTKPRIAIMVLVTVAVAGVVATWGQPDPAVLLHAVLGAGLVAASASIWNQWIERHHDALMPRTAARPIPAGRVGGVEVALLGSTLLIAGLADLLLWVNWPSTLLAATTWLLYLCVYTPLKRRTRWNTLVGAVPGALPVLIGWSATGQAWDVRAAAMFLIVFLWQFPHFMAIAWKYRQQYERAGFQMMTVVDPSGRRAGVQAVVGALALLPVSLVPAVVAPSSLLYTLPALFLGLLQLGLAMRFCRNRTDQAARSLLRMSLIYLPAVMLGLAFIPVIT